MYLEEPKAELFGNWQTEVYIPDPVENGRVPRNEYGNVELYKESMLPRGGVHLRCTLKLDNKLHFYLISSNSLSGGS